MGLPRTLGTFVTSQAMLHSPASQMGFFKRGRFNSADGSTASILSAAESALSHAVLHKSPKRESSIWPSARPGSRNGSHQGQAPFLSISNFLPVILSQLVFREVEIHLIIFQPHHQIKLPERPQAVRVPTSAQHKGVSSDFRISPASST